VAANCIVLRALHRAQGSGFVEKPGKIRENLGKICENVRKIPEILGKLPENTDKNGCLISKNWRPTWGESNEDLFCRSSQK